MRDLVIDSFAGGGGASTGIEMALTMLRSQGLLPEKARTHVDFAINHDRAALAMHEVNHPLTKHLPHDVWKISLRKLIGNHRIGLIWASPDCFVPGTLVCTPDGLRPIEDISVGDTVLTHKGRYRRVTSTLTREADTVRVKGYGHYGLVTTPAHAFYSKRITTRYPNARKENGCRVAPKKELIENPYWPSASTMAGKLWATPHRFPEARIPICLGIQFSEDFFYFLGRWIGDGSLNKGDVEICCGLVEADEFKSRMEACPLVSHEGNVITPRHMTRPSTQLSVWACAPLVEWLRREVSDSGHTKRLPVWCLSMQRNWREALLNGYVDADGHRGRRTLASSVSRELAIGMRLLATSLGHACGLYKVDGKDGEIEGRSFQGRDLYRFAWTTDPKNETVRSDGRHMFTPVKEVVDAGRQTVVSLQVEEDESFVADGIVVHNCRHHSRAKGSAPVSESVRDLANVLVHWLGEIDPVQMPDMLFLENVPEFEFWGPTIKDAKGRERPDKSRRGESFAAWIAQLRALGYVNIEWRLLRAWEYGVPTLRKRLFIVASRSLRPIVWPAPTHGMTGTDAVTSGALQPWVVSGEIIDWTRECPSIFLTRARARRLAQLTGRRVLRPLAPNTMVRIAMGVKRYILEAAHPYLVAVPQSVEGAASDDRQAVFIAQINIDGRRKNGVNPGQPADRPMATILGTGSHQSVVAAHMISLKGSDRRASTCAEPHAAICAGGQHSGVVTVPLVPAVAGEDITALLTPQQARKARQVARFLREHGCWDGGEFVTVGGYVVADIGMRMLTTRELARAQGFPDDYVLDAPYEGGTLTDTQQRHKIGNSVCPQVAAALVAANYRPPLPADSDGWSDNGYREAA